MILLRGCILQFLSLIMVVSVVAQPGDYTSHRKVNHGIIFTADNGIRLGLRFYTDRTVRLQWARAGEDFLPDTRYEMVADHRREGTYRLEEEENGFVIFVGREAPLRIEIDKRPMRVAFRSPEGRPLLGERHGIRWRGTVIETDFVPDPREHFCGMGHSSYGLVESIDLRGRTVSCNYGEGKVTDWGPQAVLTVPFYLSGKGYGVFLNSPHYHSFSFNDEDRYGFSIDTRGFPGQMDIFFLYGPSFSGILDQYTRLTGRPRLPQRSIFGLQLSDKGYPDNEGVEWWKRKITEHRQAGFPLDHIVNDNRWRAGSGAWSGSWFEWDSTRYPDPAAYADWCEDHHLTMTLDLNRNIAELCEGWKPSYNLPMTEGYVKEGSSAPDYSNPDMRNWIWTLFWNQSFDPALGYPGDALWIDETDECGGIPDSAICANGRSWAENRNYYPFLVAKAVVQEGWDNENKNRPAGIGPAKRPWVWMRSMSAGAQRYASHWTGDLLCDYDWMKAQVRAMQVSGLCGLPFFNHDAGGFRPPGPDDDMYIQWAMAFGSLTPIWRPHGMGRSRWPLDRPEPCRDAATTYGRMRYEMMPYLYTYAYRAHKTGEPMAKAMAFDYREEEEAWAHELQYMWGDEILVAPNTSAGDTILQVWLPGGQGWYDQWEDKKWEGGQVIRYPAKKGKIPMFIKEGAVIPRHPYSVSTMTLDPEKLVIDVHAGKDGEFTLYEDDGITEYFRLRDEFRLTRIEYRDGENKLFIHPADGHYVRANKTRKYRIRLYGSDDAGTVQINGKPLPLFTEPITSEFDTAGYFPDRKVNVLIIQTGDYDVRKEVEIEWQP